MTDPEILANSDTKGPPYPEHKGIGGVLLVLVLIVGALAFAWLVWPTRYRYDRLNLPGGGSFPVRIDRFSGTTEVYSPSSGGWFIPGHPAKQEDKQEDQTLPPEELQKLTGTAEVFRFNSQLSIRLYNGSAWNVNEITVDFVIPNKQQGETRRRYRIKNTYSAEPLQTTIFHADLDSLPAEGQKWGWGIVEAKGTKQ